MKNTLLISALVAVQSIALAESSTRVEARSKAVSEQIIAVSECSTASGDVVATTELAGPDRNGDLYTVPATKINAKASLVVKKCVKYLDYNVNVTGSFWNSKESNIEGSGKSRFQVVEETIPFYESQTIRDQKNTTFGGDNTVAVAMNILEGLKFKTSKQCGEKKLQLQQISNSNMACSN